MTHAVKVVHNVRIPMADGTTLAADLYLPDTPGFRGPAIIEYTPYHKINNAAYGPRATRYPFFASQGYVFVNLDIRGTGDSGGYSESPSSAAEVDDGVAVIQWCARQDWCDGAVGMIGISYTAGVCFDAARRAPPELKAVVLCQMCSDWYTGMACPGGTLRLFAMENFAPLMAAYNYVPPVPERVGESFDTLWRQRLDQSTPWSLKYVENLLDGPFWQARLLRDQHAQVKAATFLMAGWSDWYGDDMLRTFDRLTCPKRVIVGPWTHNYPENAWPLPRMSDRHECLRWFDKYLKGVDTEPDRPVDQEPPVTLFVRHHNPPAPLRREDAGVFRSEAAWPPPARWQTWALADGGRLQAEDAGPLLPEAATLGDSYTYRPDVGIAAGRYAIGQFTPGWGMADDQRLDEGLSLVYSSPVLAEPLEVIGMPRACIYYEAGAATAFLSLKLCDVAPDGSSVLVTQGLLNLTHRHSHSQPEALEPGRVYPIELPLQATAYRFAAGHRLRLMISGADVLNAWPTPLPYQATVRRNRAEPSHLALPVVAASTLPPPRFQPSQFPPLPANQVPAPDYAVTRDLIGSRLVCSYRTLSGVGVNRSTYTVDLHQPAQARVDSDFTYDMERPGWQCRIHARCVTTSDAQVMDHRAETTITVNGQPYWNRSWSTRVPRIGW